MSSRRPVDNAFSQQELKSWAIRMDKKRELYFFLILGIIMISLSSNLLTEYNAVQSFKIDYDGTDVSSDCAITTPDAALACQKTFSFTEDVKGPLFVYYELDGFMQNNRRYAKSVSTTQLRGQQVGSYQAILDCYPLVSNGSLQLNPCGLQANSFFNDIITINSAPNSAVLDKTGLAYDYELNEKFKQPDGFLTGVKTGNATCLETLPAVPSEVACTLYTDARGVDHYYYYPNADTTQYLYQTFPSVISPIEGVTNEDFIVWMRLASFTNFRKLYGKIDTDIVAGDTIVFDITANYDVSSFGGVKSLILTTASGNEFIYSQSIGTIFVVMGTACVFISSFIFGKKYFYPRSLDALKDRVTA